MSVYKRGGVWWYDFEFRGRRYRASSLQDNEQDARAVESERRRLLRQEAAGVAVFDPRRTPLFTDWANVFYAYQLRFMTRPDVLQRTLRAVLEFWGSPTPTPTKPAAIPRPRRVEAPYHNLHLGDPIVEPKWILDFDRWMTDKGLSGSSRNSYLSCMSGLYRVALQPEYRALSGVLANPFRDMRRSTPNRRVIALEPDQVVSWIRHASYHVGLAATIAMLAPKLRLQTILDLKWDEHFDQDITRITIPRHKTVRVTGAPQITPISSELRAVLKDAKSRSAHPYVIHYRGEPVASIKRGAANAAREAGLRWGVRGGVTFHTLRHSAATLLARMGMPERLRMELMGHKEIRTTQQYTHLAGDVQVQPHEDLAAALGLGDVLTSKPRPKAKLRAVGETVGTPENDARNSSANDAIQKT